MFCVCTHFMMMCIFKVHIPVHVVHTCKNNGVFILMYKCVCVTFFVRSLYVLHWMTVQLYQRMKMLPEESRGSLDPVKGFFVFFFFFFKHAFFNRNAARRASRVGVKLVGFDSSSRMFTSSFVSPSSLAYRSFCCSFSAFDSSSEELVASL